MSRKFATVQIVIDKLSTNSYGEEAVNSKALSSPDQVSGSLLDSTNSL